MGKLGAQGRMWAAVTAAGAALALCFALRGASAEGLGRVVREPPARAQVREDAVDINAAGLEELMSLPGIGEVRAGAILEDRRENGPYRYPEDLIRVDGIGTGTVEAILDQITTGGRQNAQDIGG